MIFQEGDKIALAKSTGLDQKQINNWFINQRKRYWKPSENMPFSMVDGLTGRFLTDEWGVCMCMCMCMASTLSNVYPNY